MEQFWAVPMLAQLPANREDYDSALRLHGSDQYKAGWLPYSIMDGWQQLVKDFALWRADVAGEKFAKDTADREWFAFDRRLRELITLRDLGEWSHFVGDGSQPLHATVHFNGWGDFPNPQGFTLATNFHARFETDFINANISEDDVMPLLALPSAVPLQHPAAHRGLSRADGDLCGGNIPPRSGPRIRHRRAGGEAIRRCAAG